MKLLQKKQKPFLILFAVLQLFVMNSAPAFALFGGGPSIPSASSIMSDVERRYHLDTSTLQDQGEMMNVSSNKGYAPEVMLYFSPNDPKAGEKMTAKAFPMYFSNTEKALYYTWTLKRKGCNIGSSNEDCDLDNDGRVTVEDWKIEAARIIVQNGYTSDLGPSTTVDTDRDGYDAHYGGDDKLGMSSHCYIHDPSSGTNYELGSASNITFDCPGGTSPVCMTSLVNVESEQLTIDPNVTSSGSLFSFADTGQCTVSGVPACSAGAPVCSVGEPRCVTNPTSTTSCGSTLATCSATSDASVDLYCRHLFPKFPGYSSGDGSFTLGEERKWKTNPIDPSTADNENKDEANVVGLGQSSFTWNYEPGDKVGVAVEGTSMYTTKYNDSSSMIMWAFSKKDCPLSLAKSTGSYVKSIKGYNVTIPVADVNLNDCIERNLVDPTEGGQATKLDVSVSASPSDPLNDPGNDKSGDLLTVQSMIANPAQNISNTFFKWTVYVGSATSAFSNGTARNITADLRDLGLLGNTDGNALDTVNLKLDIPRTKMNTYIGNGRETGYLRFRVDAEEHFAGGGVRKGNSDVIVKFLSTSEKITAFRVISRLDVPSGKMQVSLDPSGSICNSEPSDRTICRVIKNEIIGLKVDDTTLSNFQWTINSTPLTCTSRVSNDCNEKSQGPINYFPVTGNVGDTYTVVVTANNTTSGKSVTLTRAFNVVEPQIFIESVDKNAVWQKYLGKYRDFAGSTASYCKDGYCDDLSESIYQSYFGTSVRLRGKMIPNFLSSANVQKEWLLDGVSSGSDISLPPFDITKESPGTYTVNLLAQYVQSDDIRRALLDIWGVSSFESPEINFFSSIQLEVEAPLLTDGPLVGPRKYYAAIASYIPASLLFTFRISISVILILFVLSIIHSLLEERRVEAFVRNSSQKH